MQPSKQLSATLSCGGPLLSLLLAEMVLVLLPGLLACTLAADDGLLWVLLLSTLAVASVLKLLTGSVFSKDEAKAARKTASRKHKDTSAQMSSLIALILTASSTSTDSSWLPCRDASQQWWLHACSSKQSIQRPVHVKRFTCSCLMLACSVGVPTRTSCAMSVINGTRTYGA